jgi:hypothetical protein
MPESASSKTKLIATIQEYKQKLIPITDSSEKIKVQALLEGLLDLFQHNNYNVDLVGLMSAINNKSGEWFLPNVTHELIPLAKFYLKLISEWLRGEANEKTFSKALDEIDLSQASWWIKGKFFAAKKMLQSTLKAANEQGITELRRVGVTQGDIDQITGADVTAVPLRKKTKSVYFTEESLANRMSVFAASSALQVAYRLSRMGESPKITTIISAPAFDETEGVDKTVVPAPVPIPASTPAPVSISVSAPISQNKSRGIYSLFNYAASFVPEDLNFSYIVVVVSIYALAILPPCVSHLLKASPATSSRNQEIEEAVPAAPVLPAPALVAPIVPTVADTTAPTPMPEPEPMHALQLPPAARNSTNIIGTLSYLFLAASKLLETFFKNLCVWMATIHNFVARELLPSNNRSDVSQSYFLGSRI